MNIGTIWENMKAHEGEVFDTEKRLPFTYRIIDDNHFVPIRDG